MNILITGGTGFIGSAFCRQSSSDLIYVLSRQSESEVKAVCGAHVIPIASLKSLASDTCIDAIINLAGEGIAERRWSTKRKARLVASRIDTTEEVVALIKRLDHKPQVLISGSAVGFYGDQGQHIVDEHTVPNPEFSHELCAAWERAALGAADDTRVCLLRTGLVVGQQGGFLKKMHLPFRLGLGGRLGDGRQYMPWIHRQDMIGIIRHLFAQSHLEGAFNATSPNPVSNAEFTSTLAQQLKRPAFFHVPAAILKLTLGEMSSLLLGGQNAVPKKLLDDGYQFDFPLLESALSEALSKSP